MSETSVPRLGQVPDETMDLSSLGEEAEIQRDVAEREEAERAEEIARRQTKNVIGAVGAKAEKSQEIDKGLKIIEDELRDLIDDKSFEGVYEKDRKARMDESYGKGRIAGYNKFFAGADADVIHGKYTEAEELKRKMGKVLAKTGISGTIGLTLAAVIGGATLPASLGIIGVGTVGALGARAIVEFVRVKSGKERKERIAIEKAHYNYLNDLRVLAANVINRGEDLREANVAEDNYDVYADPEYAKGLREVHALLHDYSKRYVTEERPPQEMEDGLPGVPAEITSEEEIDNFRNAQAGAGHTRISGESVVGYRLAEEGEEGAKNIQEREKSLRGNEKFLEKIADWSSIVGGLGASLGMKCLVGTKAAVDAAHTTAQATRQSFESGNLIQNQNFADYPGQKFGHTIFKAVDGTVNYIKDANQALAGSFEDLRRSSESIIHTVGFSADQVREIFNQREIQDAALRSAKQIYMIAAWGIAQLGLTVGATVKEGADSIANHKEAEERIEGEIKWLEGLLKDAKTRNDEKRGIATASAETITSDSGSSSVDIASNDPNQLHVPAEVLKLNENTNIFKIGNILEIKNALDSKWDAIVVFKKEFLDKGYIKFEVVEAKNSDYGTYDAVWLSPVVDGKATNDSFPVPSIFLLNNPELIGVIPLAETNGLDGMTDTERNLSVAIEIIIKDLVSNPEKDVDDYRNQLEQWSLIYLKNKPELFVDGCVLELYKNGQLSVDATRDENIITFYFYGDLVEGEYKIPIKVDNGEEEGGEEDGDDLDISLEELPDTQNLDDFEIQLTPVHKEIIKTNIEKAFEPTAVWHPRVEQTEAYEVADPPLSFRASLDEDQDYHIQQFVKGEKGQIYVLLEEPLSNKRVLINAHIFIRIFNSDELKANGRSLKEYYQLQLNNHVNKTSFDLEPTPDAELPKLLEASKTESRQPGNAELREISEEESSSVLDKLTLPEHEFRGQTLSRERLVANGLAPKYEIEVNGKKIWTSSAKFTFEGRVAGLAYINNGDTVTLQPYLESGSQGVFRFYPGIRTKGSGDNEAIRWYNKGAGEESLALPIELQQAISNSEIHSVNIDEEEASIIFVTACPQKWNGDYNPMMSLEASRRSGVENHPLTLPGFNRDIMKQFTGSPESLDFTENGARPNFDEVVHTWTETSSLNGIMTFESFYSNDGRFEFLFGRTEDGRAWVAHIEVVDSEMTRAGLKKKWVDAGVLTTPVSEYREQLKDKNGNDYAGQELGSGMYVDAYEKFISKIPMITEYQQSVVNRNTKEKPNNKELASTPENRVPEAFKTEMKEALKDGAEWEPTRKYLVQIFDTNAEGEIEFDEDGLPKGFYAPAMWSEKIKIVGYNEEVRSFVITRSDDDSEKALIDQKEFIKKLRPEFMTKAEPGKKQGIEDSYRWYWYQEENDGYFLSQAEIEEETNKPFRYSKQLRLKPAEELKQLKPATTEDPTARLREFQNAPTEERGIVRADNIMDKYKGSTEKGIEFIKKYQAQKEADEQARKAEQIRANEKDIVDFAVMDRKEAERELRHFAIGRVFLANPKGDYTFDDGRAQYLPLKELINGTHSFEYMEYDKDEEFVRLHFDNRDRDMLIRPEVFVNAFSIDEAFDKTWGGEVRTAKLEKQVSEHKERETRVFEFNRKTFGNETLDIEIVDMVVPGDVWKWNMLGKEVQYTIEDLRQNADGTVTVKYLGWEKPMTETAEYWADMFSKGEWVDRDEELEKGSSEKNEEIITEEKGVDSESVSVELSNGEKINLKSGQIWQYERENNGRYQLEIESVDPQENGNITISFKDLSDGSLQEPETMSQADWAKYYFDSMRIIKES